MDVGAEGQAGPASERSLAPVAGAAAACHP